MDKEQKGYLLFLFFVSPLIGLMNLIKLKCEKQLTFFGTLFFGLVGSVYIYVDGNDGYSHLMRAKTYYLDMSLAEFFKTAFDIITLNASAGTNDIYLHIISFVSASLLRTPGLIHIFAGLILGYFFTKSVLLVLKGNLKVKKGYILLGFIFLFLLIRSISALNSIRMWTGMWVLFYGTYSWAISKDKKYLYVILFSVFVHFSYAVILIPLIGTFIIREKKKLLILIYAVSFFTTFGFSFIEAYIPQADLIEQKTYEYAIDSDEKADRFEARAEEKEELNKDKSFYSGSGQTKYINYSIVGLTVILMFFYLHRNADKIFTFLVSIGIGLYSFANMVAFAPSLQGRTKTVAATFILAAAIHLQLNLKNYRLGTRSKWRLNTGLIIFLISSIPMVLYQISFILQGFSFFLLLFPQISWLLGDNDFSIREAIGFLID